MACLLCFGTNEDNIDLNGDEAKQFRIATVLFKFFSFCLNVSYYNDIVDLAVPTFLPILSFEMNDIFFSIDY